jgi:hypothetical protein
MTLNEIKAYFGSSYQFNLKTKMNHRNYKNWAVKGFVPIKTQIKLEEFTNGELKADLLHLRKEDNHD